MWQYYVMMVLLVVAFVSGLASKDKSIEVKHLSPAEAVTALVVVSLVTWLSWSLLSVNWMWLSIGLMAVSILSMVQMTYYCAILRKTVSGHSSYGTFICIVQGVAYTIFYFKYVV